MELASYNHEGTKRILFTGLLKITFLASRWIYYTKSFSIYASDSSKQQSVTVELLFIFSEITSGVAFGVQN